eukprot:gb/GFBE01053672.1/.p1 GENE.gb/GFBE01053672.1/~~gb/GFBE01053672.1/.p1  ORF type:complete len:507 (+),score=102.20 gb/GFBE01053672.1/:1-1521(+)
MGRFSSWVQARGAAPVVEDEPVSATVATEEVPQLFIVDNLQLRSKSNGVRYRLSPNLADKHESRVALFGRKVKGTPCGGCWVKVGKRYLPTHIGTAQVLRPAQPDDQATMERSDDEADRAEVLEKDNRLGQMLFGAEDLPRRDEDEETLQVPRQSAGYAATQEAKTTRQVIIRPETSAPGAEPLLRMGEGALYEVIFDRVAIRSAATTRSTTLEVKEQGSVIELFEWDSSRLWRRCPADLSGTTAGWVLLDHPEYGPLLRPKGVPLSVRPLEPICVAAAENQLVELRRFLAEGLDPHTCDAGGVCALALAAQADAQDCVVHLIEAGAGSKLAFVSKALELSGSSETKSLLQALLGHFVHDQDALQDALSNLSLDARLAADAILERLADAVPASSPEEISQADNVEAAPVARPIDGQELRPAKAKRRKGGALYEVTHKAVAIRYLPSTTADMVGTRISGQLVELFEPDASGKWRKFHDPDTDEEGWMLLHHPQIGNLLTPLDEAKLE